MATHALGLTRVAGAVRASQLWTLTVLAALATLALALPAAGNLAAELVPAGGPSGSVPAISFVPQALAGARHAVAVTARPGGGYELYRLRPGERLQIAGTVRSGLGLWSADAYWVRVEGPAGPVYGFVSVEEVEVTVGSPPPLDLRRVPLQALVAQGRRVSVAATGEAEVDPVSDAPSLGSAAGAGQVAIPWLPPTVSRWRQLFEEVGRRHGVDPELLAIVALVESGGSARATSAAGAVGLMQLMPSTAQLIAAERGITDFELAQLTDPEVNVDFGAYYLAQQLRAFGRAQDPDWQTSVELAAAAYNGGPGAASSGRLSPESRRYRRWVGGMWRERHLASSGTYTAWLAAGGRALVQAAGAEMLAR